MALRIANRNKKTGKKINLKELTKYGFVSTIEGIYFKPEKNDNNKSFETGLLVNPINKEYDREIVYYLNSIEDNITLDADSLDLTSGIDTLYKLMEDGYIEEIQETKGAKENGK